MVHLAPAPVVARVAGITAVVRPGDAWFAREVAVAKHLAAAGAPAVAPSGELDPGPHHRDGLVLSFWELTPGRWEDVDPKAAGRALRECHAALADYPGELPSLGALAEAESLVERLRAEGALAPDDDALLSAVHDRVVPAVAALPRRPLHGDSHLGNVLPGRDGARWCDWEDTFCGPLEWDLGCLLARAELAGEGAEPARAALAAHRARVEPEALDLMVRARVFQLAPWHIIYARVAPERGAPPDSLLDWLRARV
jgi:Ser/Thr protein kinase RdoA (MazF antagonist)